MAGIRQLRIIGLTAFVVVLIFVLHRAGSSAASLVHAQAGDQIANKHNQESGLEYKLKSNNGASNEGLVSSGKTVVSNNIVDSKNDEKTDAEINKSISKDKSKEEESIPDLKQDTNKDKSIKNSNTNNNNINNKLPSSQDDANEDYDAVSDLIKIRSLSPMTIFSKTYCPYSKKLKSLLLNKYSIIPAPNVVELDKHGNGKQLQEYLFEKSGRNTVPNVLIGNTFESRGGSDDFATYDKENELISKIEEWGQNRIKVTKNDTPSNA